MAMDLSGSIRILTLEEVEQTLCPWFSEMLGADITPIFRADYHLFGDHFYGFVLDNGQIAGGCCLAIVEQERFRCAGGSWLFVNPSYRRHGLGTYLRNMRSEICRKMNINYVVHSVEEEIEHNVQMGYKHLGHWSSAGSLILNDESVQFVRQLSFSKPEGPEVEFRKLTSDVIRGEAFQRFDQSINLAERAEYLSYLLNTNQFADTQSDGFYAVSTDADGTETVCGYIIVSGVRKAEAAVIAPVLADNEWVAHQLLVRALDTIGNHFERKSRVFVFLNHSSNPVGAAVMDSGHYERVARVRMMATLEVPQFPSNKIFAFSNVMSYVA